MYTKSNLLIFIVTILLMSCNTKKTNITAVEDYNQYLNIDESKSLQIAVGDYNFWKKKLEKDSSQFPYRAKIAAAQSHLFQLTGNIDFLIDAEQNLVEANEFTQYNKAGYLRALARNYISQHKFKEALALLKKAESNGENLKGTQKMLFDVHLELGNTTEAQGYLMGIQNFRDFDYLIRFSKWSDHNGNLDAAIKYMEKALAIAEASNNKSLMQWSYTNLADFYGHDGQIEASYKNYLKALKIDPSDAYAKKGIAWILYSYERNPNEALRIINAISDNHSAPDYYLLKAEIAEFENDNNGKEENLKQYFVAMTNDNYGDMYNKYNVLLFADKAEKLDTALTIANKEIENRPTAQSYDLLAWTYYKKGDYAKALQIAEAHVANKTHEPEALYHMAKIYKSNGKLKLANSLKQELLGSVYELGPVMALEIERI